MLSGASVVSRRWYSRSRAGGEVENFDVRCGSSGRITVDLYNTETLTKPTSPLIIYLPPTGVHLQHVHTPIPSYLFSLPFSTALARINYRWNIPTTPTISPEHHSTPLPLTSSSSYNNYPFPTPLHDTFHAFDFLTNSLLPSLIPKTSIPTSPYATSPTPRKTVQRPLFIYGDFLGGTLATSLALTESHSSRTHPFRIAGLITKNAIFDWTVIATSKDPKFLQDATPEESQHKGRLTGSNGEGDWNEQTLQTLKTTLFTSPQSAFDSFASPELFFRTAGFTVPARWPGNPTPTAPPPNTYSTSIISDPESETEAKSRHPKKASEESEVETQRISPLKFPPRHTIHNSKNLKLPRSLFLTTSSPTSPSPQKATKTKKLKTIEDGISPLSQAEEMTYLMRRSIILHEFKDRALWDEDLDAHSAAEGRVRFWGSKTAGDGDADERVRVWIEEGLD